jgi:hypothetical protein
MDRPSVVLYAWTEIGQEESTMEKKDGQTKQKCRTRKEKKRREGSER